MAFLYHLAYLLNKTKAELPVLAVAGGILLGTAAAYLTNWKELCYPLQFSERTQLEQDAMKKGSEISAMTLYHANALDIAMKVFEAHNRGALFPSKKDLHFAEKLKQKAKETEFHHNLDTLTRDFNNDIRKLKTELNAFYSANPNIASAHNTLKNSWAHTAHEQYMPFPETRLVTTTDSDGDISTELRTEIVLKHVWTDHTYNLERDGARRGISFLNESLFSQVEANPLARIQRPSKINEQNRKAIIDSRKQQNSEDKTSDFQAEDIGFSWGGKAKIPDYINYAKSCIKSAQKSLASIEQIISTAPAHAESRTYTPASALLTSGTLSSMALGPMEGRSSDAPKGFGFYGEYTDNLANTVKNINDSDKTLNESDVIVRDINANLETLAKADNITPKEVKIAIKTRKLAEQLIRTNFSKDMPLPTKRWYIPLLLGLAGIIVGGAAGWAVDKGAENYQKNQDTF